MRGANGSLDLVPPANSPLGNQERPPLQIHHHRLCLSSRPEPRTRRARKGQRLLGIAHRAPQALIRARGRDPSTWNRSHPQRASCRPFLRSRGGRRRVGRVVRSPWRDQTRQDCRRKDRRGGLCVCVDWKQAELGNRAEGGPRSGEGGIGRRRRVPQGERLAYSLCRCDLSLPVTVWSRPRKTGRMNHPRVRDAAQMGRPPVQVVHY
jgi:hypothetical protein